MRRVTLTLTALFITAGTAAGQGGAIEKGTFEIGAFGRYNRPTTALPFSTTKENRWGAGGHVGVFVVRNLALELDASSNAFELAPSLCGPASSACPLRYTPVHLQAVYNAPVGDRFFLLAGAGISDQHLSGSVQNNKVGVGGLAGFRWRASPTLGLRFNATLDVLPSGTYDVMNTYFGAQFGIDVLLARHACDHAADMIAILPTSVRLETRRTETFSATSVYCGASDDVVYRLTGPGTLDSLTGRYTASVPGTAQVVAYSRKGKLAAGATVTVIAPVRALPPPPPAAPQPVASVAIAGPSRVKAGAPTAFSAQPRQADGSPVTRAVSWSVVSGAATVDGSGTLLTTGAGTVVIQARSESATVTYSVTSYDWVPFRNGPLLGVTLESAMPDSNQALQPEFPNLLVGCMSGSFVLGFVTTGFVIASGDIRYSVDDGPSTADTWLETSPTFRSISYFGGSNAGRKLFANRIAAGRTFTLAFTEHLAGDHPAVFAVTGMKAAIAPVLAACPIDAPRRPLLTSADSGVAINGLITVWKQVTRH